ncbi:alcohol oxidase [Corynespora cassiicola Philippines]|uniref:Alcohol oxidase n=1 Tax=Corynespora cassiicola Philippines TaxID=1448308 RepID=A0A2T2PBQ8_CORCC|nr:alcohol oxidase [Corynespora cassiicola Philippines]
MRYDFFTALFAGLVVAGGSKPNNTYEYIVIGSGPGGGPLAANLARAGHTVLLIEAGDDQWDNPNSATVWNNTLAINDPLTRWDFFVSRDESRYDENYEFNTWRQTNGEFYVGLDPPPGAERLGIYYPRAGTLGGCTMHNAASISLPADVDWQDIVDITGDDSWSTANMRQYLIRLERCHYLVNGSNPTHGFNGYIDTSLGDVSWAYNATPAAELALRLHNSAAGEGDWNLTHLVTRDINEDSPDRDDTVGVFGPFTHSNHGVRSSPNNYIRATLADARRFPLTVQLNTLATKVLFLDSKNGNSKPKAIGVEYLEGQSMYAADPRYNPNVQGTPGRAFATREVIVSGGVYNTPQLLKLSGVGPKKELKNFNIPVVKDLPGVGINMHDNYEAVLYGTFANRVYGFWDLFVRTSKALRTRDIHFYCGAMQFIGFWPGMPGWNPNEFTCGFMQLHPRNINGSVTLRSANPRDVPNINLGFFSKGSDDDLASIVEAINLVRPAFHSLSNNTFTELRPCAAGASCTDEAQAEFLRTNTYSHHVSGSCQMGSDDNPHAVLDSKFRVRGVEGLRVVDGSIFPVQPGELPSLATFMISEKALDDILADV